MTKNALAAACARPPFSNGTEGEAWMSAWCEYCEHEESCDLLLAALLPDEFPWPEAWLPEPTGEHHLPSKMVCLAFSPGPEGDPGAEERAARIEEVQNYWRASA